jgi:hypothetical protein
MNELDLSSSLVLLLIGDLKAKIIRINAHH